MTERVAVETVGQSAAIFAGAISAMHENLGKLEAVAEDPEDTRDIDSARVYLEAAFWKLEVVMNRELDRKEGS